MSRKKTVCGVTCLCDQKGDLRSTHLRTVAAMKPDRRLKITKRDWDGSSRGREEGVVGLASCLPSHEPLDDLRAGRAYGWGGIALDGYFDFSEVSELPEK